MEPKHRKWQVGQICVGCLHVNKWWALVHLGGKWSLPETNLFPPAFLMCLFMSFPFKSAWIIFLLLNINVPLSVKEGGKLGLVHIFLTLFTAAGGMNQMPAPNTLLNQACTEPRCYPGPKCRERRLRNKRDWVTGLLWVALSSHILATPFHPLCSPGLLRESPSAGHSLLLQKQYCVKGGFMF